VGRRKIAQLMKETGVWVRYKKKYKATTNSDHNKPIHDNVLSKTLLHKSLTKLMCKISPTFGHQKAGYI
jgi:hypothetical protein